MAAPVDPPTLTLGIDELVDWLELHALFDPYRVGRFDALIGSLGELQETAEDDIGERDRQREQLTERLENEIASRQSALHQTYPFTLSASGDELCLVENWGEAKYAFYLVCLITSHVTKSPILRRPPIGELLTQLRNSIFQIIATLALAGLSVGPAFSVGWPRQSGETIVQLLHRAVAAGGCFTVRDPPRSYIPPQEKDGGVDVIAWKLEGTPPPTAFYFAQAASGRNWPGKSVTDHARIFSASYMIDHMTGNLQYVTLIPFRVLDRITWQTQHQLHMAILERLRLPQRAWEGLELSKQGVAVDEADRVDDVTDWLVRFVAYAQAA